MRITGIDHIVFTVADAERSVAWYGDVLGLAPVRLEEWRAGRVPFVSLRLGPNSLIDLQEGERSGRNVDHVALLVEDADLAELVASGRIEGDGPHELFGAQGTGQGVYVSDPDGNRLELRTY